MIKLTDLLENDILKPRRSPEERQKNYKITTQKKIQKYIKDGSKGDLDLRGSPVEKLPDNLKVEGNLNLMKTPTKELPDNLKVSGDLNLYKTPIEKLPDNLQIGDSLDLGDTPIKELPDNLQVGGYLNLINTPLSKTYSKRDIRDMIEEKGGYVKGNIS